MQITEGYQLAPSQAFLWSLQERDQKPQPGAHGAFSLEGPIDPDLLERAVRDVISRFEILRTRFKKDETMPAPQQIIGEIKGADISFRNGDDRGESSSGGSFEALLNEALRQPVDPLRGALQRCELISYSPLKHVLLLGLHPLCGDRASLVFFVGELNRSYEAQLDNRPISEERVQYADYCTWQLEILADEETRQDRRFWKGQWLKTAEAALPEQEYNREEAAAYDSVTKTLDAATNQALQNAADRLNCSELQILFSCWAILLARFQGSSQLTIGHLYPGRGHEDLETAIGLFEKVLPVKIAATEGQTFAEFLHQVGEIRKTACQRHDYFHPEDLGEEEFIPYIFESWQEETQPPQNPLKFRLEHSLNHAFPFKIKLELCRQEAGFACRFYFDHRLYAAASMRALADQFETLLKHAIKNEHRAWNRLAMVSPADQRVLLELRSRTNQPKSAAETLHGWFEKRAAMAPDRTALIYRRPGRADLKWSYGQVNDRANQLARCLADKGRHPIVGLYLERSPEMVVAILAVLKSGGAYLPLDPSYPARRIQTMIRDSGVGLVIGEKGLQLSDIQVETLLLDGDETPIAQKDTHNLDLPVAPQQLAYVIYTSGTTGVPNGVMIPHAGVVNYLSWCLKAYPMTEGHGSILHSPIGFDLTVTSLFAPLLAGKPVLLLPRDEGLDSLVHSLRNQVDISLLKVTPSHMAALTQLISSTDADRRVKTLVVGGEELPAQTLTCWRTNLTHTRIVNEYGPTETTVGCCAWETPLGAYKGGRVPIGRPIDHTVLHVFDRDLQARPDGVPGELCIGGIGLARGYLGRPDLTAAKFVPDPSARQPGARLYKSGDLGRYRPDGVLDYLGRIDQQVKVRGYRIELGELEQALAAFPRIAACAAKLVPDQTIGKRLVAYIVAENDGAEAPTVDDINEFLKETLPVYMLPEAYVNLDTLPLTANGKLDRDALPKPETIRSGLAPVYIPPRTANEETLAQIWSNVLKKNTIGIDDNYYALGGNSIIGIILTGQARKRGITMTVTDLHTRPTIRELAEATARPMPIPQTAPFSLISEEDRAKMPSHVEDSYPLNLLQEGMIFHRDFSPKSAVYHAIASVRLKAVWRRDAMETAVDDLVRRHPLLRTSFEQTSFSVPLQLVHATFKSPLFVDDLRHLPDEAQRSAVTRWVEAEKLRGFELDEYPLIRFKIHLHADDEFNFTYGFHHEIVDGWSEALMITELFDHYFSIVYDKPISFKPPVSSFRDSIALELQALATEEFRDFWTKKLDNATLMQLPRLLSGPRADKGERDIVRIAVPVSKSLSEGLKKLAATLAVPLKSVLMAAHIRVMNLFGGNRDTLTYTVTNGRPEHGDGDKLVGLFVNSLAFRLYMGGGSWENLIMDTLKEELASMPYRRFPMAELKRHKGRDPLSETLFFFTDYHIFKELEKWGRIEHLTTELYGESTFPFCGIFRLNRETDDLEVRIEYDRLQFSEGLVESIAASYVKTLDAMVDNPSQPYEYTQILYDLERDRILQEWNQTTTAEPADLYIHHLLERRAAEHPQHLAVIYEEERVSYEQLNRRADRLADHLQSLGIGPEVLVGICLERSVEMVVAIFAILKAGGAYVPLDPGYPEDRLTAILDDAQLRFMVAMDHHRPDWLAHGKLCRIDPNDYDSRKKAGTQPRTTVNPDQLAYMIYTSGSTGKPKGVAISHRNLVHSTRARMAYYEQPPSRFLLLSSYAFDSSVVGLFWPLSQGGTLVLPREGLQLELPQLLQLIARHGITHCLCIPSLYTALLEQGPDFAADTINTMILAGESCPKDLFECHRQTLPHTAFYNEYGPTEATVWSSVWRGRPEQVRTLLPIGSAIADTQIYVLDYFMQILPVGVAGEIHIGGRGLARNYFNRPGLTAERFVPDPFSRQPGQRLYRSGDLARYLPEGKLEFLERVDHQVKIHGFRIELGELEAILETHPKVQRAVVQALEDHAGEKYLAAYILSQDNHKPEVKELKSFSNDKLPKFMQPATYDFLQVLPLTATGKIDRKALPEPETRGSDGGYVAPQTPTEVMVSAIWARVLGLSKVGVKDDFYALGGESLRAMRIMAQTRKAFQIDLPVSILLNEESTVAGLAERIDTHRWAARKPTAESSSTGIEGAI